MAIDFNNPIQIAVSSEMVLSQFVPSDAEYIFRLINSNRAHLSQRGDNTAGKYQKLEDVMLSITEPKNPDKLRFGIWVRNDLVGSINLTPVDADGKKVEVGYYLGSQYTGRGYIIPAVISLTDYAFGQGFEEVFGVVHPRNIPSMKVLVRAGYNEKSRGEKVIFSRLKISQ